MLLTISQSDFRRLERYLPKGLAGDTANPLDRAAGQLTRMVLSQSLHPGQKIPMDEIAALEMVQYALSEVGDGKTYVWRRGPGRLSGLVQPTASFKEVGGKVCRHLLILMTFGITVRKQEGVACRLTTGRWELEG